jgi:hypothetical protein
MNPDLSRILIFGGSVLVTLVTGLWLSKTGRPVNAAIFNVHKLVALGAVIFLALRVYPVLKTAGPAWLGGPLAFLPGGVLVAALFATGALLGQPEPPPTFILRIHQAGVLLVIVAAVLALNLLYSRMP